MSAADHEHQWIFAEHDACTELQKNGNGMVSRLIPSGASSMTMKNNVLDPLYICGIKRNAAVCGKAASPAKQFRVVQQMANNAQRNGIASVEKAINANLNRTERAKRARCERVVEQAQASS